MSTGASSQSPDGLVAGRRMACHVHRHSRSQRSLSLRQRGRKFKHCCLQDRAGEDSARLRLRGAEGRVVDALLRFIAETWGEPLMVHAWDDFWNYDDVPEDLTTTPEFESMFIPWVVLGFVARAGAVIDSFVSLTDVAPTLLESAGLKPLDTMTGRTMLPLLRGASQPGRNRVSVERERHANVRRGDLSYPVRAIRTNDYLYIRNFRPDRWPAADPQQYVAVGPFGDIDGSPSKSLLMDRQTDPTIASYSQLATAKRPAARSS